MNDRTATDCDPRAYPPLAVTVDMVVLSVDEVLGVLLVKRGLEPSLGWSALPGGFVQPDESVDEAAQRKLREETGVTEANMRGVHLGLGQGAGTGELPPQGAQHARVREGHADAVAWQDGWSAGDRLSIRLVAFKGRRASAVGPQVRSRSVGAPQQVAAEGSARRPSLTSCAIEPFLGLLPRLCWRPRSSPPAVEGTATPGRRRRRRHPMAGPPLSSTSAPRGSSTRRSGRRSRRSAGDWGARGGT